MPEPLPGTYTALVRYRSPNPFFVGTGNTDLVCPSCSSVLAKTVPADELADIVFRCHCGTFSRLVAPA